MGTLYVLFKITIKCELQLILIQHVTISSLFRPSTGRPCWPRQRSRRSCRQSKSRWTSATLTASSLDSSQSCRLPPSPSSSPPSSRKPSQTSTSALCTDERRAEKTRVGNYLQTNAFFVSGRLSTSEVTWADNQPSSFTYKQPPFWQVK